MAKEDPLSNVPLFARLSRRELKRVAGVSKEARFDEGAVVAEEGEDGLSFYVIMEGEAKVQNRGGRMLARLIPGDFFGEISLMDGGPRTASVVATTHLSALTLSRRDFTKMLEAEPQVTVALLKHAALLLRRLERPTTG
jgi:CRP/FNR family transcriptional regulator, cyclic AMP receptor protein